MSGQQEKNEKVDISVSSDTQVLKVFNINHQLSKVLLEFLIFERLIPESIISLFL